jgi:hypothetical protein
MSFDPSITWFSMAVKKRLVEEVGDAKGSPEAAVSDALPLPLRLSEGQRPTHAELTQGLLD